MSEEPDAPATWEQRARALMAEFDHGEPCDFDHDGNCQAHNWTNGCGIADLRALLAEPVGFNAGEMEAIRWALGMLHKHGGPNYLEVGLDLPASVVAWVMESDQ
jgi:hypothetical protein